MVKFDKIGQKFDRMLFMGDIHGNFGHIGRNLNKFDFHNSILFQVGDFGVGFAPKREAVGLKALNGVLESRNCWVVAIRGNHDDPGRFKNDRLDRILFLEDYTVLSVEVGGKSLNVIGIGGAISIDRRQRKIEDSGYFVDEGVVFENDVEELDRITDIDVILTHTAPDFAFPFGFNRLVMKFASLDDTLISELTEERKQMRNLLNAIIIRNPNVNACYYGHFHIKDLPPTYYKGVEFRLLGEEEIKEYNAKDYSYLEDDHEGS